ncbi:MAG: cupin domain-containing protein [Myxococcales bacterium]|nr:cupin domain-containing protein [Myxococcales bacterium]
MTVVIKHIEEIAPYEGEHAIQGIRFRPARQALGVSAWGMNVFDIDPHTTGHPEHDHKHDGQEELYVVLEGSIVLIADGKETKVTRGQMVRVGPETTRKIVTREEGARVLALGATPNKAYEADPRLATT